MPHVQYLGWKPSLIDSTAQQSTEKTFTVDGAEHRVAWSSHRVVWSVDGVIDRLFDFKHDEVIQAAVTVFPHAQSRTVALTVLTANVVHVHYAHSSSILVPLSFNADLLIPFDHGLLLRSKSETSALDLSTPALPLVPSNSFYSSQVGSWGNVQPHTAWHTKPLQPMATQQPTLSHFPIDALDMDSANLPRWYCLLDPLAEAEIAVEAIASDPYDASSAVEIDYIDPSEDFLHLSQHLTSSTVTSTHDPTLAISYHHGHRQYSIWQLAITDLEQLTASDGTKKPDRIRSSFRRSSYNPRRSTGSNTPLARAEDYAPKDQNHNRVAGRKSARKSSARISASFAIDEDLEDSFLDDFNSRVEQSTLRKRDPSRRTSSIVARSELSSQPQPAPTLAGSFTGQSFTQQKDRSSFGRSRFSGRAFTPGSTFLSDVNESTLQPQPLKTLLHRLADAAINCSTFKNPRRASRSGLDITRRATFVRTATLSAGQYQDAHTLPSREPQEDVLIHELRKTSFDNSTDENLVRFIICFPRRQIVYSVTLPFQSDDMSTSSRALTIGLSSSALRVLRIEGASLATGLTSSPHGWVALLCQNNDLPTIKIVAGSNDYNSPVLSITEDLCSATPSSARDDRSIVNQNTRSAARKMDLAGPVLHEVPPNFAKAREIRASALAGSFTLSIELHDPKGYHLISAQVQPLIFCIEKLLSACEFLLCAIGLQATTALQLWAVLYSAQDDTTQVGELKAFLATVLIIVFGDEIGCLQGRSVPISHAISLGSSWQWTTNRNQKPTKDPGQANLLIDAVSLAQRCLPGLQSSVNKPLSQVQWPDRESRTIAALTLMLCLYLEREEFKLDVTILGSNFDLVDVLSLTITQFAEWHGMSAWHDEPSTCGEPSTQDTGIRLVKQPAELFVQLPPDTPSPPLLAIWLEETLRQSNNQQGYPTYSQMLQKMLAQASGIQQDLPGKQQLTEFECLHLPRLHWISTTCTERIPPRGASVDNTSGLDSRNFLETMPPAIAAVVRQRLSNQPDRTFVNALKTPKSESRVGREETWMHLGRRSSRTASHAPPKDVASIVKSAGRSRALPTTAQYQETIKMIYREDKRCEEAAKLLNPLRVAVAEISPRPNKTEAEYLEEQKSFAQHVYKRTMALPAGQAVMLLDSQKPPLMEKLTIQSFNTSVNMQPSNNTINVDRSSFTEEKVAWAFFHAGVNAGLRLSRDSSGIDTSWFVLNKPNDLSNRNAGLLLALGLRGHLRSMARWLAFKYLTAKHSMTSIGLLIGLSASHMGSMDVWMTRMLSIHITRLLPPGAAELNLTPPMQAAGIIGIGLLYYNTSHRRMSEVLLSEIEHIGFDNHGGLMEDFRDESYRLAAGLAFGFINLGQGNELHSLHDLSVSERLITIATGSRDANSVHYLDQAVAGALVAIALIWLKTGNRGLAKRLNVSSTERHFDHTRPDILLLQTTAKHLILWDEIRPDLSWIQENTPDSIRRANAQDTLLNLISKKPLTSKKNPFYNIIAGLCWSIALRFAGSGHIGARDTLLFYFDVLNKVCRQRVDSEALTFDENLARNTLNRIVNILALALSTIMAGSGDLEVLRRLRGLHGFLDSSQTFGHHQASHMAIGLLFLGGGRYTLNTSNLAVAGLMSAFYPIFPGDVLDDQAHLQALRHFWVFAAEERCLIPRNVATGEPISLPIKVLLSDETVLQKVTPCLLPELQSVRSVVSESNNHWEINLDNHETVQTLQSSKKPSFLDVRPKSLAVFAPSVFERDIHFHSNDVLQTTQAQCSSTDDMLVWLMTDTRVKDLGASSILGMLGCSTSVPGATMLGDGIDDMLSIRKDVRGANYEALVKIRMLLVWAASMAGTDERLRKQWLYDLQDTILKMRSTNES